MNKEQYAQRFGRMIEPNEIIWDFDDRERGDNAVWETSVILCGLGYRFEVWKAAGQKSAHIHMKDIRFLDLEGEQLKKYKMFFLLTHTPIHWLEILDFGLCGKHRVAEELKPHYKYKTTKYCLEKFNEKNENVVVENLIEMALKKVSKVSYSGSSEYSGQINITTIAEHYGLRVHGTKCVCPFHKDTNPSLSLNNEKGLFYCFGCRVGGDIVKFVQLLEDLKNG